jgi:hypothetical protein
MSKTPGKGGVYVVDEQTNQVVPAAVEPAPAPAPAEPETQPAPAAEPEDEGGM